MTEGPVTRYDLDRARDEAIRVATLEATKAADESANKKIVAAVEAVVKTLTLQIGLSEKVQSSKIDTVAEKFKTLRAWGVAALLGGQALAGVTAAIITRTTPTDAGRAALAVIHALF